MLMSREWFKNMKKIQYKKEFYNIYLNLNKVFIS
jgi:hypothetical protein